MTIYTSKTDCVLSLIQGLQVDQILYYKDVEEMFNESTYSVRDIIRYAVSKALQQGIVMQCYRNIGYKRIQGDSIVYKASNRLKKMQTQRSLLSKEVDSIDNVFLSEQGKNQRKNLLSFNSLLAQLNDVNNILNSIPPQQPNVFSGTIIPTNLNGLQR